MLVSGFVSVGHIRSGWPAPEFLSYNRSLTKSLLIILVLLQTYFYSGLVKMCHQICNKL